MLQAGIVHGDLCGGNILLASDEAAGPHRFSAKVCARPALLSLALFTRVRFRVGLGDRIGVGLGFLCWDCLRDPPLRVCMSLSRMLFFSWQLSSQQPQPSSRCDYTQTSHCCCKDDLLRRSSPSIWAASRAYSSFTISTHLFCYL